MVEIETIWTAEIISIIVLKQNSFVLEWDQSALLEAVWSRSAVFAQTCLS